MGPSPFRTYDAAIKSKPREGPAQGTGQVNPPWAGCGMNLGSGSLSVVPRPAASCLQAPPRPTIADARRGGGGWGDVPQPRVF